MQHKVMVMKTLKENPDPHLQAGNGAYAQYAATEKSDYSTVPKHSWET
jgi:hypothetical protein